MIDVAATNAPTISGTHPYADKFPMLPDGELAELAESIKANGLRNAIVITPDGLILDGRNRAAACELAGVDRTTVVYTGTDLAEYVIDCNSSRRHMSTGARAMATALVLAADGRRGGGRWRRGSVQVSNGDSSTTSWIKAVQNSGLILDHAPDLAAAVVAGDLALDAAYRQAVDARDADRLKLEEQRRLADEEADAERFIRETAPELADQVGGPFESFVEAQDVWNRRNREDAARRKADAAAKAKAKADREKSLSDFYTRLAEHVQFCNTYGQYDTLDKVLAEFEPRFVNPPQLLRELDPESLHHAARFIEMLAEWAGARNA